MGVGWNLKTGREELGPEETRSAWRRNRYLGLGWVCQRT